jgi:4-hydroxy-tetrahydrodipicolinate reductase
MKLGIIGYGKMGKTIERLSQHYGFYEVVIIDNEEDWLIKQHDLKDCHVAIEFSTPQSVYSNLVKCFELKIPVVCGTTGWNDQKNELLKMSQNHSISFVYGSNFSIGANLFFKLNEWLAQQMKMQPQYEISIEEVHHIHKKDVPSGTALIIKQGILSQMNEKDIIPIVSRREGEVTGEHLVSYNSCEDTIQIKHIAHNRDMFAQGALKAAVWLLKHPGIYAFETIFGEM